MRENTEIILESLRRFDPNDLGPWAELWSVDGVGTAAENWPEQGPFVGRYAIAGQFERLFSEWSDHRFEDVEVTKVTEKWSLLSYRLCATGTSSGLPIELELVAALRVEDGRISEGHFRWTREQALKAAGLSG